MVWSIFIQFTRIFIYCNFCVDYCKKIQKSLVQIGKWKSISAEVSYPTMKNPVKFSEILEFQSLGQPVLNYSSFTFNEQTKSPMHLEHGYLRADSDQCTLAFLTAMNFGLATLEEGYVKDKSIVLTSACLGIMKFAKQTVLSLHRCYKLNEKGELEYTLFMETPQTPLTKHVVAVYKKEGSECADPIKNVSVDK